MTTRVLLVDDHFEFRILMDALLSRHEDLEVVAQAGSLAEARDCASAYGFDVAVLDLGLPDGEGTDLIAELHDAHHGAAVLIMSSIVDPDTIEKAILAGADEVLDKFTSLEEIVKTVRRLGNP